MYQILNQIINYHRNVAQISDQKTRILLLEKWSKWKEQTESTLSEDQKKDLNERLFSLSPIYGKLYETPKHDKIKTRRTNKIKNCYIDCETAGLTPDHALLQIALIVEIDGEVKHEENLHLRPDPTDLIDPKALELNHLTKEEILNPNRLLPIEAYRKLKSIFLTFIDKYDKKDKLYLVGQNVHFDYGFLLRLWEKMGDKYLGSFIHYHKIDLIAVTALYRMAGVLPSGDGSVLPSMKLEALCKYFGMEPQTHEASSDIRQTREIFRRYIAHARQLPTLQSTPPID